MTLFPPRNRTEPPSQTEESPLARQIRESGFTHAEIMGDRASCTLAPYLQSLGLAVTEGLGRDPQSGKLKDPRFLQLQEGAHEILVLGEEFSSSEQMPLDSLHRIAGIFFKGLVPRKGLCIFARKEAEPSLEILSMMRQSGFRALTLLTAPGAPDAIRFQVYQRV